MKVALVHEWFESYAGSERVFEQLLALFPQADIYSLVDFMPPDERALFGGRTVNTSFIQKLPFARRLFRNYLALMPIAVEQFSMQNYDLVISSSHAVAKGVITGPNQVHVSYVHSPMRYAWDMQDQYLGQGSTLQGLKSLYVRFLLHKLRMWDLRTAPGVDVFVANSSHIARRIRKVYRRDATIVHPPVDVDRFELADGPRNNYLIASRFVPYKRVDLVVEAFRKLPDLSLTVVGKGSEEDKIRRLIRDAPNITLLPPQPQASLIKLIQEARAFICAAEEDFGIGMVEAQACGTPLIAFGRGGACDILDTEGTVGSTGILFQEQNVESVIQAVRQFEANRDRMTPSLCRANALRFSRERFLDRMLSVVEGATRETRTDVKDERAETSLYPADAIHSWMPAKLRAAE